MKKFIILNHKMNLEYDEVVPYIQELNKIETDHNVIVCPSYLYLSDFMNYCTWGIGAQNVSEKLDGNYTGEISTLQLKSLGVEYSIIGHYERKKHFKETNQQINEKLNACLDANLSPILCFGESGNVEEAIASLEELLQGVSRIDFIIFAYEPLKVAEHETVSDIVEQIEQIYDYLFDKYQIKPTLVYGGGLARKDIGELMKTENLAGIMIGKVSSKIEQVQKIVKELSN